jgi:hypothetical protein
MVPMMDGALRLRFLLVISIFMASITVTEIVVAALNDRF